MAAAPKSKGPKDPFDEIDDKESGVKSRESGEQEEKTEAKKSEIKEEDMSPEDILDSDEEIKEEKGKEHESDEFDDLGEKPKQTFVSKKEDKEDDLDQDLSEPATFGKPEHNLEDLAKETPNDEKYKGGFGSYAKLGGDKPMEHHSIPHVSSLSSSQVPNSGVYSSKSNQNAKGSKIHVFILLGIGLVIIIATVYLLKNNFTFPSSVTTSTPAPTAAVEPTPLPTPTPTPIDRSKFKIRILNGTPVSGLAATEAAKLKGLGYQIDKTGNATNSAFTKTQIRSKPGLDILIQQLIKDLSPDYSGSSSSSALKVNDTVDGEVILGK